MSDNKSQYAQSGVDTQAADDWVSLLQKATHTTAPTRFGQVAGLVPGATADKLVSGIGDYASVYAQSDDNWIATSCDGVGTKLLWTLEGLGSAFDLAQDLVAMNVNDLLCVGAQPALFLDYLAVGSKSLLKAGGLLENFVQGLQSSCRLTGQLLVGGETAQMPDLYGDGHFDLAGFSVGFMKPHEKIGIEKVQRGSHLYGWASSGPHSNGFTWLRRLFDSKRDQEFIAKNLMKPTELYVEKFLLLRHALKQLGQPSCLQAAFHITGSGLLNLLRAQPKNRSVGFDLTEWNRIALPQWVDEVTLRSKAPAQDLWTSFNMGFGFLVVLDPNVGEKSQALLNSLGLLRLGTVIEEPCIKVGELLLS